MSKEGDCIYEYELYHYGVKGMRWGVRRFQNKNGRLTTAGKKRYSEPSKSKHRARLEEQYRQAGLSEKDAQEAASKRIRTERLLAAAAGVTVTACALYAFNKNRKNAIDGVIKASEKLQRIEMKDTNGKLHDVFYAAKGEHDSKRYKGMLGYTRKTQTGHAWLMELQAQSDIKVASRDKAAKMFGDLYKNDSEFQNAVKQHIGQHFSGKNKIADINNMSDRNIRKMYENFNSNLIDIRQGKSGADAKFYEKLKKAGYGAIQDINDMKYSGYRAKNPLIVFDNSSNNILVKSSKEIKESLLLEGARESLKAQCESLIEPIAGLSAASLTGLAAYTYASKPRVTVDSQFDQIE